MMSMASTEHVSLIFGTFKPGAVSILSILYCKQKWLRKKKWMKVRDEGSDYEYVSSTITTECAVVLMPHSLKGWKQNLLLFHSSQLILYGVISVSVRQSLPVCVCAILKLIQALQPQLGDSAHPVYSNILILNDQCSHSWESTSLSFKATATDILHSWTLMQSKTMLPVKQTYRFNKSNIFKPCPAQQQQQKSLVHSVNGRVKAIYFRCEKTGLKTKS